MLNPSIDNLMKKIDSKYTLVTVSAKRARELRDNTGQKLKLAKTRSVNLVGKALEEIEADKVHFEREELKPGEE
ncbi:MULTISPECIES: DNA-directed RNA polymerase subunit omega [Alteribacter]|uniref:DNA-directed RNA polymerase subunit omega n=1 Tax=Alteribacter keqinensis TaxID=2483800 RepID=A0A3M7TVH3_9BACI|nr:MULTISPECIES: DNA-directed RNA polymerase subunit omega [Alteribacter]MBM7095823.1 DNA-directed RNA polymerase subunit omega [Alteribacter salitolerans]RNA69650.1 DNA-directed RNA polymerase subunit omega [Alteribacter keqinensis]